MTSKYRAHAVLFIKLAITAVLIYALRDQFDPSHFSELYSEAPVALIALPLAWVANQYFVSARLWFLLTRINARIPFRVLARSTFGSLLVGSVVPGVVGADVSRVVMLRMHSKDFSLVRLSSMIFFDRLLGLIALLVVSGCAAIIMGVQPVPSSERLRLAFMLLGAVAVLALPVVAGVVRLAKKSQSIRNSSVWGKIPESTRLLAAKLLAPTEISMGTYAVSLLISILAVGSLLAAQVFVAFHLFPNYGSNPSPALIVYLLPSSVIASVIPITPLGIGISQAAMKELFELYMLPTAVALTVVSLSQVGQVVVALIFGLPALWLKRRPLPLLTSPLARVSE